MYHECNQLDILNKTVYRNRNPTIVSLFYSSRFEFSGKILFTPCTKGDIDHLSN